MTSAVQANDLAFVDIASTQFPSIQGRNLINVNMMPFSPLDMNNTLPIDCQNYIPIIEKCLETQSKVNKTMYLTIQESSVTNGQTQRRSGLHIESPNLNHLDIISSWGGGNPGPRGWGGGNPRPRPRGWGRGYASWGGGNPTRPRGWGKGRTNGIEIEDGIYMASNLQNSCKVWPYLIDKQSNVVDKYGGIEEIRSDIGEGEFMKNNNIYWMTDATPHEAMPSEVQGEFIRQFFRLVVGEIAVWFSKHNTENPTGYIPDAPIIEMNKFD